MLTGDARSTPTPRSSAAPPRCWPTSRCARAAGRRRARGDGRVPLLRRAGPGLGLAGAAARAAAGAVPADVGHPRRRRRLAADLTRRTGRETALVADAERPVPLTFTWALTPLTETLEELVATHQAPVYVVHFTQKAAVEHAASLLAAGLAQAPPSSSRSGWPGSGSAPASARRSRSCCAAGIGVHHAGMLPRYRRLVEKLAQAGLLTVICGTDTLGVGINVPIRTVLFTGLAKYDGNRQRMLRNREFPRSPAGPAGRASHRRVRRRAGARARDREREGEGQVGGQERGDTRRRAQGQLQEAARGHGRLDRADLRPAGRGRAGAAAVADEGRQRDADQRPRPRGGRLPGAAAAPTDNHEDRRSQPGWRGGRCGWPGRCCGPGPSPGSTSRTGSGGGTCSPSTCPRTSPSTRAGPLRAGRARRPRPRGAPHTLDIVSVVEAVLEAPGRSSSHSSTGPAARPSRR